MNEQVAVLMFHVKHLARSPDGRVGRSLDVSRETFGAKFWQTSRPSLDVSRETFYREVLTDEPAAASRSRVKHWVRSPGG